MSEEKKQDTETQKPEHGLTPQQERRAVLATAGGLIVFAIVLVSLLLMQPTWWKNLTKHLQSPKPAYGYTLTPPQGWAQMQKPPQGASVAFEAPASETDTTGMLRPYIVVQTSPLTSAAAKMTLQQLVGDYVAGLQQNYQDYKQIASDSTTIEHIPALFMTFSFTQDDAQVTNDTLFVVDHGVIYDVNGQALTSTWSQHSKDIQKSLLSFHP